jgi:hypothetical protein
MNMELDTTPAVVRDQVQDALDLTAKQGSDLTMQSAVNAESALGADASLLSGETAYALRVAITAQRAQIADGERSAHYYVNTDEGAMLNASSKAFQERMATREAQHNQARDAAIDELLASSAPVIDSHIPSAKVNSMGGLLRDALNLGAKPEALVKEAIARNDDVALHHLLGDSLWPLYVAKGVDLRALRVSAAEQRWAAGQTFPGSDLLAFLCGDGGSLGVQARDAAVSRFNATKRAATINRKSGR